MHWADADLHRGTGRAYRFDFDAIADTYDRWYEDKTAMMYDRLEKKAISRLLPRSAQGLRLLEVGCGTGHWSRFFSEYGFEVTGVDISERMIEIARRKAINRCSFQVADAQALPFADDSFDVTAAITSLEFVGDARIALNEMVRCTHKDGGRLLIGTLNALARLNRRRSQDPESLYSKARLFSPKQLRQLLAPYGRVRMIVCGFVPERRLFLPMSLLFDMVGGLLHIGYGVFIAAEVRL